MAQILIVDDEAKIRVILEMMLVAAGHQVQQAENGRIALQMLESKDIDLVVSDVCMDELGGFDLLAAIREKALGCPVIFITAFATLESAVEALRLGASDYLVKPFKEQDVILAIERALGLRRILSENIRLREEIIASEHGELGVFNSSPMLKVKNLAQKVASSDATVLLSGESGTGKEVVARYIHQVGNRKKERFVAMNCAAIAPNLIEAELFGHEKGAFTSADKSRPGKFEFAGKGSLFLDEVGELPFDAQATLLRVIQEKSIQRVGSNQEIPIKCRLICATNRDLAELVRQGQFREDLFYRLAVFPIELPPLRERLQDIVPLVDHCLKKLGNPLRYSESLTPAAKKMLQSYTWPGNVRELFNVIERAVILKVGEGPFSSDDFPYLGWQDKAIASSDQLFRLPATGIDYEGLQRTIVEQSLEMTLGNQSAAARLLGVSRAKFRTLQNMLDGEVENKKIRIKFHRGNKDNK